jgi:predicted outer membrane repeat protein
MEFSSFAKILRHCCVSLSCIGALILSTTVIAATTWTVISIDEASSPTAIDCSGTTCASLRGAINASAAGDTIVFAGGVEGTIVLSQGTLAITHDLTLQGPSASSLTISGNNAVRAIHITAGTVDISGLSITDGAQITGGSGIGAGVLLDGAAVLNLMQCSFTNNSVDAGGGAIYSNGTLTIDNCTFSGNSSAAFGGGAIVAGGAMTISNSFFSGNTVGNSPIGGGAFVTFSATTVINSTFFNNSASQGGAINANSGSLTVTNSTFSSNKGPVVGAILSFGNLGVANCTFAGNTSSFYAGAIESYGSNAAMRVYGSIFSQNTSDSGQGGLENDGGTFDTVNAFNLFYGNLGNGIEDDTTGYGTGAFGYTVNIPIGDLLDNGGPTPTMLPRADGAAIDALPILNCPVTDQRGYPRPQGKACDIGAVELDIVFRDGFEDLG